jgi:hypothetical protein
MTKEQDAARRANTSLLVLAAAACSSLRSKIISLFYFF